MWLSKYKVSFQGTNIQLGLDTQSSSRQTQPDTQSAPGDTQGTVRNIYNIVVKAPSSDAGSSSKSTHSLPEAGHDNHVPSIPLRF